MTSTTASRGRLARPAALGGAVVLLLGLAGAAVGPAAQAAESPIPGVLLPVAATDVTGSDRDLESVGREVVVTVPGPEGPEVHKLRTRTQAEATLLAARVDATPGVTAEVNAVVAAPRDMPATSPKSAGVMNVLSTTAAPKSSGRVTAQGLTALSAEPHGAEQWGLRAVRAESAWPLSRGEGLVVAVIDTGVDATHPDLAGRVAPQVDLVADGLAGDPIGHGTHVAGIIAASLDGEGVAGLANEVTLLPIRVMDAQGYGDLFTVTQGIYRAVDAGAKVINMSLGTTDRNAPMAAAIRYAVRKGVTVVASGGNSFEDGNPTEYPAALPGVIGVSSMNSAGQSSGFANTGRYIDITAPGERILSTIPGGQWAQMDGTSMAAPFVSATAALVRVANPTWSRAQVQADILGTAADDSKNNGRDSVFGYGLLRADLATSRAARAPGGVQAPPASVSVRAVGGATRARVDVNPNRGSGFWTVRVQAQTATGTWTDLPGSYRTTGAAETRTVDLPQGTYRFVVAAKYGYRAGTSAPVTLAG